MIIFQILTQKINDAITKKPANWFATEEVAWRCSVEKVFWEISPNLQENTCASVSFLIMLQALACFFIKKVTLAQVLSSEICKIFKNNFFYRTPPVPTSNQSRTLTFQKNVLFSSAIALQKWWKMFFISS